MFHNILFRLLIVLTLAMTFPPSALQAGEYDDLTNLHGSMVSLEGMLLDRQREIRTTLEVPNSVLMRLPNGDIAAIHRHDLRNTAGLVYDWATQMDVHILLRPHLPPEVQSLIDEGISSGIGRIKAVDWTEDKILDQQGGLRDALIRDLAEIEKRLDDVRKIAANAIARRDALSAGSESEGLVNGGVCTDPAIPSDGEALVATIGYGGGKYPYKDTIICTGAYGFMWDAGGGRSASFAALIPAWPLHPAAYTVPWRMKPVPIRARVTRFMPSRINAPSSLSIRSKAHLRCCGHHALLNLSSARSTSVGTARKKDTQWLLMLRKLKT